MEIQDRFAKETKRVEELETSLSTASTELADVKRETEENAAVLRSKVILSRYHVDPQEFGRRCR